MTAAFANMQAEQASKDPAAIRRALADELAAPALRSVRLSGAIAAVLFVSLIVVAVFVPIASGTLATGQVAVEGERKMVQHSSGGIVSEILVKEGDVVSEGDVVLRLDAIQAGAAAGVVNSQIDSLRAQEAVRLAEATGKVSVEFPQDMTDRRSDPGLDALLTAEQSAFAARKSLARSQAEQLDQQLTQIGQSVSAAEAERKAQGAQGDLLEEELDSLQPLLEKGLVLKSRVLSLQRSLEDARGRVSSLEADSKRLAAKAEETRTMRARIEFDRRAEAADALRTLRADLSEALDRQLATEDTLRRTEIKAPISGVVMAVRATTVGGVVESGQPLMEIVPQSERLIVRAHISPRDADSVRQGMPAVVRLTASGARSPPRVDGKVLSVSADALSDPRTGESYFEVRVAIPNEEASKAPADAIAPGLPAEVLIKSGSHTMLDYLFRPVERAMFQSMRDS